MVTEKATDYYQDYVIYYDQREVSLPYNITNSHEILKQKELGLQETSLTYQGPVILQDVKNRPFPRAIFPELAQFKTFFREYDSEKASQLDGTERALFFKERYDRSFSNVAEARSFLLKLAQQLGLTIRKYQLEGLGDQFGCPMTPELWQQLLTSQQPLATQTYTAMVTSQWEAFQDESVSKRGEYCAERYEAVMTADDLIVGEAYFSDNTHQLFTHTPFTSNGAEVVYQVFDCHQQVVSAYVVESDLLKTLVTYQHSLPTLPVAERSFSYVPIRQTDLGEVRQVTDFDDQDAITSEESHQLTDLYLVLSDDWSYCENNYYCSMEALLAYQQANTKEYLMIEEEKRREVQLWSPLITQVLAEGYQLEMQWQKIRQRWEMTSVDGVLHDLEHVSVVAAPLPMKVDELVFSVKTKQGELIAQQLSEEAFYAYLSGLILNEDKSFS